MKKAFFMFLVVLMLGIAGGSAYAIPFPPPPFILPIPPPLVVIPGTYVYAAPDPALVGLFFFEGFWWRQYEDRWYRAPRYDSGRWMYMRDRDVPMGMRHLPPDYRDRIRGGERLRYDDVNHNWRSWKNNRRWEKDPNWKSGGHGGPAMHDAGHDKGGPAMHDAGHDKGGHDKGGEGHDKGDKEHGGSER